MERHRLDKKYCLYDISDQRFELFQTVELEELKHLPEPIRGYKDSLNVRASILNFWLQFEFEHLLYAPKSDRLLMQDTFLRIINCSMQSVKHYEIPALMNTSRASYVYIYFLYYEIYVLANQVLENESIESAMFNLSDTVFNEQVDKVLESVENYYLFHEFKKINNYLYVDEQWQQCINRAVVKAYKQAYEYLSNENIPT